nr:hypothetical protein [uncultured Kingella sp.]
MKLKKNVALIMVAAAMLAGGGYAEAANSSSSGGGGFVRDSQETSSKSSTDNVGKNTTGAIAATGLEQGFVPKEGGIFSEQDKKDDATKGYKEAWAQQGCTKEAWVELKTQYDKNMRMSIAQSAKIDQRIMDVIKNPNQMNIEGFSMLGCDLNNSLKTVQNLTNTVREVIEFIGSGSSLDKIKSGLEKKARGLIQGILEELENGVKRAGCQLLNKAAKDTDAFLYSTVGQKLDELKSAGSNFIGDVNRMNNEGTSNSNGKVGNSEN